MIVVIKSNRVIAKQLQSKLIKVSNITLICNGSTCWISFCNEAIKADVVSILSSYKKQRFEVCSFPFNQLSLTVTKIGFTGLSTYINQLLDLPLKRCFYWYNGRDRLGRQAVTPLTNKQFNNIIKIN